jgi:hypothetical protein
MAERINSGQVQLRGAGNVPMVQVQGQPVDFVAPRVQAQADSVLAQTLDRITSVLFDKAAQQSQLEGQQYVADNPPTPKQLLDAMGGNTSELGRTGENLSGSSFRIYDKAVAKARSIQLASAFEGEGINQLLSVHKQVQLGTMTAEDARTKIKAVSDGLMPKNFAQIDAEAAIKFRATMAMHGNSVLKDAYRIEGERTLEQRQIKANFEFENQLNMLPIVVGQGDFGLDGKRYPVSLLTDVMRKQIVDNALLNSLSPEQTQSQLDKFARVFRETKINVLTRELTKPQYTSDVNGTLAKIRKGELGNLSLMLQDMSVNDFDAVAKATSNFMVAANIQEAQSNKRREDAKQAGEAAAIDLLEQIFPLPDNSPKKRQLIAQLNNLPAGSVPIGTIKDLLEPKPAKEAESNQGILYNLIDGIYTNKITDSSQIKALVGKGITGKDAVSALKLLNRDDKSDSYQLERGISQLAGIPVIPNSVVVIDPKGEEFKRRTELQARALEIQAAAAREGKTLTPRQVLSQLEDGIAKSRSTEAAKAARDTLKQYQTRLGMDRAITASDLPSLREKYKNDPGKLRDITRVEQLLRQAEGGQ